MAFPTTVAEAALHIEGEEDFYGHGGRWWRRPKQGQSNFSVTAGNWFSIFPPAPGHRARFFIAVDGNVTPAAACNLGFSIRGNAWLDPNNATNVKGLMKWENGGRNDHPWSAAQAVDTRHMWMIAADADSQRKMRPVTSLTKHSGVFRLEMARADNHLVVVNWYIDFFAVGSAPFSTYGTSSWPVAIEEIQEIAIVTDGAQFEQASMNAEWV